MSFRPNWTTVWSTVSFQIQVRPKSDPSKSDPLSQSTNMWTSTEAITSSVEGHGIISPINYRSNLCYYVRGTWYVFDLMISWNNYLTFETAILRFSQVFSVENSHKVFKVRISDEYFIMTEITLEVPDVIGLGRPSSLDGGERRNYDFLELTE